MDKKHSRKKYKLRARDVFYDDLGAFTFNPKGDKSYIDDLSPFDYLDPIFDIPCFFRPGMRGLVLEVLDVALIQETPTMIVRRANGGRQLIVLPDELKEWVQTHKESESFPFRVNIYEYQEIRADFL